MRICVLIRAAYAGMERVNSDGGMLALVSKRTRKSLGSSIRRTIVSLENCSVPRSPTVH